ncbi:MAG TPA: hypothetical protein VE218_04585 [Acidobacteriaceae bacterium]|nr:hypothetical protein [Acidobacteriaceae bacterium]
MPGSIPRSIRVDGVLEFFLKRKYVLPAAVFHPVVAGSLALVCRKDGRFSLPKNPAVLDVTALGPAAQAEAASDEVAAKHATAADDSTIAAATHAGA